MKFAFLFSGLLMLTIGCARVPSEAQGFSMSVAFLNENSKPFELRISCRIKNDSDSTVFSDYSGVITLKKDGHILVSGRTDKTDLYPFSNTEVSVVRQMSREEFADFAKSFSIDAMSIEASKEPVVKGLPAQNVEFSSIECKRESIYSKIEGK